MILKYGSIAIIASLIASASDLPNHNFSTYISFMDKSPTVSTPFAMSLSMDKYFTEVSNSPYAGAINLLYKQGIVSGTGDGTFAPDRNVRYTEACKMLVTALGYNVIVSDNSLDAYTYTAGDIGVTDNVNSGNEQDSLKKSAGCTSDVEISIN